MSKRKTEEVLDNFRKKIASESTLGFFENLILDIVNGSYERAATKIIDTFSHDRYGEYGHKLNVSNPIDLYNLEIALDQTIPNNNFFKQQNIWNRLSAKYQDVQFQPPIPYSPRWVFFTKHVMIRSEVRFTKDEIEIVYSKKRFYAHTEISIKTESNIEPTYGPRPPDTSFIKHVWRIEEDDWDWQFAGELIYSLFKQGYKLTYYLPGVNIPGGINCRICDNSKSLMKCPDNGHIYCSDECHAQDCLL